MALLMRPGRGVSEAFELVARGLGSSGRSLLQGLVGGGLIVYGLRRRSLVGVGAAAVGGVLLDDALRGYRSQRVPVGVWLGGPGEAVRVQRAAEAERAPQSGFPIYSGGDRPEPEDEVDEASMESFPASDAPAYPSRRV